MAFLLQAKPNFKSFSQVNKNLELLVEKVARNASRSAIRKAIRPMLKRAKDTIDIDTGTAKRSLKIKIKTYKRSGVILALVGADNKHVEFHNGKIRRPSKYIHLIELGKTAGSGKAFLSSAHDTTKTKSLDIYKRNISKDIKRIAKRINKKAGF